jgi:hypothetical protein
MKKLFNYSQYQAINENVLTDLVGKNIDITMLGIIFNDMDVEKIIVNSAQIISVIISFFGKAGFRISLTIEGLLGLYWIYKYETSTNVDVKHDALVQLIFTSIGFAVLGALPAFKLISKAFSNGYKEYKATGSVAKIIESPYFKHLEKNESAIKKAFASVDDDIIKGLDKLPDNFIKNSTKKEIKETSKGVQEYIDDVFAKESKVKGKIKPKAKTPSSSKIGKLGRIAKLGERLFPLASYLFSRFTNKKKSPQHLDDVNSDIVMLSYNDKITAAEYPEDLSLSEDAKLKKNGQVKATVVALKVLVEDIEKREFFKKLNVISEIDSEYYLTCAVNGDPIWANILFFAVNDGVIRISYVKKNGSDISLVPVSTVSKDATVKLISYDNADDISKQNYDKVVALYEKNQTITNSYFLWSKIIEGTFKIEWWLKNFKIKA